MKQKRKWSTERILIISGLAIAVIGLVSEAATFPWNALGGGYEIPADPEPIAGRWVEQSQSEEEIFYLVGEQTYGEEDPDNSELLQTGILKIPRTGQADNVHEGLKNGVLSCGAGHMPGTALPGQPGNCVVAGYRSSALLRHLELVEPGDELLLADADTQYTYEVFQVLTVEPGEVWITEPVEGRDAVLTVFTGTPPSSNKQRLAVQAELTGSAPRT